MLRLQRITTSTRWIPEIDGLRFVAILAVLLIHSLGEMIHHSPLAMAQSTQHPVFLRELNLLGRGVELFFVISGFILAQPFLRQHVDGGGRVSIRGFYLRRLTRLEPPYILSLLLYALVAVLSHHQTARTAALSFLSSMLYLQNLHLLGSHLPSLNLVTWSLEVEVQFYLLAPVIALLFCIRNVRARRVVLSGLILAFALPEWGHLHGFFLPRELCYFLVGFLLADLRVQQRAAWRSGLWDLASILLWPAFFFLPTVRHNSVLLCVLLMVGFTGAFGGPVCRRILGWGPLALVGGMCYSMYLLHLMVMSAVLTVTYRLIVLPNLYVNYVLQLVVLLPAVLSVSVLYFIAIERPCMEVDWPRRLWWWSKGQNAKPCGDAQPVASSVSTPRQDFVQ
jgi:peptidoglycan/LPS O-acetylase OafA/YrhL